MTPFCLRGSLPPTLNFTRMEEEEKPGPFLIFISVVFLLLFALVCGVVAVANIRDSLGSSQSFTLLLRAGVCILFMLISLSFAYVTTFSGKKKS